MKLCYFFANIYLGQKILVKLVYLYLVVDIIYVIKIYLQKNILVRWINDV